MKNKIKIEPRVIRLIRMIEMIEEGQIKIPSFQRDYVWEKKQRIKLFDSISLEYPIGTILLWKPESGKRFKINDEFGPYVVDKISEDGFFYILDGFQRLATIFGCLTSPDKTSYDFDKEKQKEFSIHYDLENKEFNLPRGESEITNIPIYILTDTFAYLDFVEKLRNEIQDKEKVDKLIERGRKLSAILIDYQIPYIEMRGGDIKQAVNIFSRVNSTGSLISPDWMLSALTSDEANNFNLGEIIGELLEHLKKYNFQDLKREVILQCIQTSFGSIYFDSKIEDFNEKSDFREKTIKTIESIKKSIEFLYEELLVLERKFLPYNIQLIFISYFFYKIPKPS